MTNWKKKYSFLAVAILAIAPILACSGGGGSPTEPMPDPGPPPPPPATRTFVKILEITPDSPAELSTRQKADITVEVSNATEHELRPHALFIGEDGNYMNGGGHGPDVAPGEKRTLTFEGGAGEDGKSMKVEMRLTDTETGTSLKDENGEYIKDTKRWVCEWHQTPI